MKNRLVHGTKGEGETLVLIPGFASGKWSWQFQCDALARKFRVITYDPRGVAASPVGDSPSATIADHANDLAMLLDNLRIEHTHVLGISFGGFVAQEFALAFPQRVDRLVLASTSCGGSGHVAPSVEVLTAFASPTGLNTRDRIRQSIVMAFSPEFVESKPQVIDEFCDQREMNVVPEDVYQAQLTAAISFDAAARVGEITAPTLVLSGDKDTIVPVENSINLAAAIPNARLKIVEGASHMLFVEKPEVFNTIVTDFLLSR
ncbi:MAG TPA: alpha/beta hydrolase [Pyrinomonadaceae bacterium]|nr:alpha/beta hydrolase [Pyrinomonadaceae bacterium]